MKTNQKMVKIISFLTLLFAIIVSALYFFLKDDQDKSVAKLVEMTLPDNSQSILDQL